MDSTRFDAWTRRRVGRTAGGVTLVMLGGALPQAVAAKKKNKKKRCKKLGDTCTPGGRKCCGQLRCDNHGENSVNQTFCCKTGGQRCSTSDDCCSPFGCNPETDRCEVP